jgi:MarR family transcriptional regulator, transcriptional regulator for hemolysin
MARDHTAAANRPGKKAPKRAAAEPYLRIGFLVHDVSRMRRTLFDQAVKPLGITRAQWWALANLSRQETEGMIQSDLARLLDVGKVTIGGLIDRLEASGLVERRPDPVDRRIKRIFITNGGYEVIEQMKTVGRDLNAIILKGIPLDEVHVAEEVMHRMKDNLRDHLGPQTKELQTLDEI